MLNQLAYCRLDHQWKIHGVSKFDTVTVYRLDSRYAISEAVSEHALRNLRVYEQKEFALDHNRNNFEALFQSIMNKRVESLSVEA